MLRLPHTPRAEGYNKVRITGWMLKYDDELRQLGIRWMAEEAIKFVDKKASSPASMSDIKIINPLRDTAIQHLVEGSSCIVSDNRQKVAYCPYNSILLTTP